MTYHLIVEIDAPNMAAATARAWDIFQFTLGLPFTIRAIPPKAAREAEKKAAREAEDIADGIVPTYRRNDPQFVRAVRALAEARG